MEYRFIGDVHGKFRQYNNILNHSPYSTIQVGDMGVGFFDQHGTPAANPPHAKMYSGDHRFIRGNHDNPSVCRKHTQWIKDGTVETTAAGTRIMYVGGAWSIDREWRLEGHSWWPDEELSYDEWLQIVDDYNTFKPHVMVTHDAPMSVALELFIYGTHKPVLKSRTGSALNTLFENHKPEVWIFGHWHERRDTVILGTRFICLEELGCIDIEL